MRAPAAPPHPTPVCAVTTWFGRTRFACATDHRLTDPVTIMMNPDSCPSAFSTGLEMTVGVLSSPTLGNTSGSAKSNGGRRGA